LRVKEPLCRAVCERGAGRTVRDRRFGTAGERVGAHALVAALLALLVLLVLLAGCGAPGQPSQTREPPSTPPAVEPSGPSFSFIVCGDPQNNYGMLGRIVEAARQVDFLVIAGDVTGSGTTTELENFKSFMDSSGLRYYCVPGNHDVASGPVEEKYGRYLGAPFQSFDHENCHFILLDNSDPARGFYASQREWAERDLAEAAARRPDHVFAVCHVPPGYPYSLGSGEKEAAGREANEYLLPLLKKGGVDRLFSGHFHVYAEEDHDGLPVTITGGAGAPLHMSPENGGYYHYVLVEVEGRQYRSTAVRLE